MGETWSIIYQGLAGMHNKVVGVSKLLLPLRAMALSLFRLS